MAGKEKLKILRKENEKQMNDETPDLTDDEKWIILKAIQCLHNLKYIPDLVVVGQKNNDLLEILVEEVVKIREALHDK